MSDLGLLSAAPHPLPPPVGDPKSETIPVWVVLLVVMLVLAIGVAATGFVLGQDKTAKAPSYPAQWDARIAPYVKIAEKLRGLEFQHPVTVRFLPAADFEKGVTSDEKELGEDARKELDKVTGMMRAFGLLKGDIDLFKSSNEVRGAGILAYYSFEDQRITVRGARRITPSIRSTVVHELTHALQDQHFAIGVQMDRLRKSEKSDSTAAASVLDAIIEGDASRVQTLYRDSLTAKQRKALDAGQNSDVHRATPRLEKVPKVLVAMTTAPYTLGQALVQAAAVDGGNDAVDDLFRDAPTDESALLDPLRVLSETTDAIKIDKPKAGDGEKKFVSGRLGVLTWYLMLAERLPLREALAAADGWGSDAFVAFERDGDSCARVNYSGDQPQDTARMLTALQRWIAAAPDSPAKVGLEDGVVRFESCDPGKAADVGKDASEDAIDLVATRAYLGIRLMRAGAPRARSRCVASRMVSGFPASRLVDPRFAVDPVERARMMRITAPCR